MDERLDLQLRRRVGAQRGDIRKGHFTRQNDPLRAEVKEHLRRLGVHDAELGADVKRHSRRIALRERHHAEVGDDERVRAARRRLLQIFRQLRKAGLMRQDVRRDIDPRTLSVRELDRRAQLVGGKVAREGAQPELLAAEINGVRAEMQRHFQFFPVARRGEQLRSHRHSSVLP